MIAVFYHCLVSCPDAVRIVTDQMNQLKNSGLADAATHISIGVNGGDESAPAISLIVPAKAEIIQHGLDQNSEIPTLVHLQKWLPGHEDWRVLYFHSKGATNTLKPRPSHWSSDAGYFAFIDRWRKCMMDNLVLQWSKCVADLDAGVESVGCHWMVNVGVPPVDTIWGGNFWWSTGKFLSTLADIATLDSVHRPDLPDEKRYNAEHWISSGPRLPTVKDYHVNGIGSCP